MNEPYYRTPSAQLETGDNATLPAKAILQSTLENLVRKFKTLVVAIALPIVLLQLCTALSRTVSRSLTVENIDDAYLLSGVVWTISLFAALIWGLLAVACHRVMLNGEQPPTFLNGIRLGSRQIRYLLRATALGLPISAVWTGIVILDLPLIGLTARMADQSLSSVYVSILAVQVLLLPMQYLIARLSLALPAAALQQPMSFAQAWSESSSNGWRLTFILVLAPFLASLVQPLLSMGQSVLYWPFYVISSVVNLAAAIFAVAALSLSYDWVMDEGLGG